MHPLPGCEDSSRAALRHNGDGIMVATFAKTEPPQLMNQAGRLDGMFTKSPEMISHICLVRKNKKQKYLEIVSQYLKGDWMNTFSIILKQTNHICDP